SRWSPAVSMPQRRAAAQGPAGRARCSPERTTGPDSDAEQRQQRGAHPFEMIQLLAVTSWPVSSFCARQPADAWNGYEATEGEHCGETSGRDVSSLTSARSQGVAEGVRS